jgi:nucleoside-diphosphate-sugar epimerase
MKDTVSGFIYAAESERSAGEIVNLGTGKEISFGDLAAKIASLIGKEFEILVMRGASAQGAAKSCVFAATSRKLGPS